MLIIPCLAILASSFRWCPRRYCLFESETGLAGGLYLLKGGTLEDILVKDELFVQLEVFCSHMSSVTRPKGGIVDAEMPETAVYWTCRPALVWWDSFPFEFGPGKEWRTVPWFSRMKSLVRRSSGQNQFHWTKKMYLVVFKWYCHEKCLKDRKSVV